ncbi:MAG: imidazole glycerol phosphate synthase subunit HisH [bacterium]
MIDVAVVDYGMGNLFSVKRACEITGLNCIITSERDVILNSRGLILPGVGAFGDAVENLKRLGLIQVIKDFIGSGKPFMGICLGMQLLMSESEEFGLHKGLNIIEGRVKRLFFKGGMRKKAKVPYVGWNGIYMPENLRSDVWSDSPLSNCGKGECMYFVHSYYAEPSEEQFVLSTSFYGDLSYCSSMYKDNIFAVQFHPERSADKGLEIYKQWAAKLKKAEK